MNKIADTLTRLKKNVLQLRARADRESDGELLRREADGVQRAVDVFEKELKGGGFVDVFQNTGGEAEEFCCWNCLASQRVFGELRCGAHKDHKAIKIKRPRPSWCPAYVVEGE